MRIVGENLRALLISRAKTIAMVATELGCTERNVYRWLSEKSDVSKNNFRTLLAFLETTPERLTSVENGEFVQVALTLQQADWQFERTPYDRPGLTQEERRSFGRYAKKLRQCYEAHIATSSKLFRVPLLTSADLLAQAPIVGRTVEVPASVLLGHLNAFAWQVEDASFGREVPRGCIAVFDPIRSTATFRSCVANGEAGRVLVSVRDKAPAIRTVQGGGALISLHGNALDARGNSAATSKGLTWADVTFHGSLIWWQPSVFPTP